MQILEVSMIGVRSSVLRLRRLGSPLQFLLFPMVHVAEPQFYEAVTERLRGCDLILAEGVGGNAPALNAITASYEIPARFERSGLVRQHIPYDSLGVPVLNPDLTGDEFTEGWRRVPSWQKALAVTVAPLAGLHQLAFGSRRGLARQLELTDVDWYDGKLDEAETADELMALIGDKRDRRLFLAMHRLHEDRRDEPLTVAVVYGADHITPIVHGMRSLHRYSVQGAEWLTVFTVDD